MSYVQALYKDLVVHGDDLTEPSQASVEQVTVSSPALGDTRSTVRLGQFPGGQCRTRSTWAAGTGSSEPAPGSLGRVCV